MQYIWQVTVAAQIDKSFWPLATAWGEAKMPNCSNIMKNLEHLRVEKLRHRLDFCLLWQWQQIWVVLFVERWWTARDLSGCLRSVSWHQSHHGSLIHDGYQEQPTGNPLHSTPHIRLLFRKWRVLLLLLLRSVALRTRQVVVAAISSGCCDPPQHLFRTVRSLSLCLYRF